MVSTTVTRPFSLNFGRNPSGPALETVSAKLVSCRSASSRVCWFPDVRNRSTRPLSSVSRDNQNWSPKSRWTNGLNTIFWMFVEVMDDMRATSSGGRSDKVNASSRSSERFSSVRRERAANRGNMLGDTRDAIIKRMKLTVVRAQL